MKKIFKVIIAGSRTFNDYEMLKIVCDSILNRTNKIGIISGKARGADELGEKYAKEKGYELRVVKADWERHGKSAGYKRNLVMADLADTLIAFWDEESSGTRHMIQTMQHYKKPVFTILYKKIKCDRCMWKGCLEPYEEGDPVGTYCYYSDRPKADCDFFHRKRGTEEEERKLCEKIIEMVKRA